MTPQELKYSILQLAFQGRLVEQIKGEYTPNSLSFDIADSPFETPETWRWRTLGGCCEMYTGNSIAESEKSAKYAGLAEGYDYIATKDVSFEQKIEYDNGVRIPFDSTFKRAYKDSVLMCIEGGSAGRKIGILDRDVCFGNKLCMFRADKVLNTFLFYYLQSREFKKLFSENMTGIIGGVSIKKLKEILIPIPPITEQKRIVDKIEELLLYIDRYDMAWRKLEDFSKRFPTDMQKSIIQLAIQGKLTEQRSDEGSGEELYRQIQAEKQKQIKAGILKKEKPLKEITEDEIPFEIPETWKWVRLREICNAEISYGIIKLGDEDKNGVHVLRCSDVKENHIIPNFIRTVTTELSQQFDRTILHGGEIVINVRGTLGGCSVVPHSMKGYNVAREVAVIRQCPNISAQYIVFLLMSQYFQTFMFHGLRGIAYKGLNMGTLSALPVPVPPLAEQKRIVDKLEEILPLCEKLKK